MGDDYFHPLSVNLTGSLRHHYDEKSKLPAHNLVIKPLIEKCIYAYVFGLKIENELYESNSDVLIRERGKFKFDITKECVIGHEYLWNATTWKRGSIVIVISGDDFDFSELFKHTSQPGLVATPNSGNSASAIKMCKKEMDMGHIAICFPASNGIEWMTIYAKDYKFESIINQAEKYCLKTDN